LRLNEVTGLGGSARRGQGVVRRILAGDLL